MEHLHFLMAGDWDSAAALQQSNLASVRMRVLPACMAMKARASFGEQVPGQPDRLLVTKIGGHDIQARQAQWLAHIEQAKSRGAAVWIDYTDHHLGFASVMSNFYAAAMKLADVVTVPSACMQRLLSAHWSGTIHVIPDAIEVENVAPKNTKGEPATALWFGHASNIGYLRNFLETGLAFDRSLRLIVLSNDVGLRMLTERPIAAEQPLDILLGEWSIETMREAASQSDLCLIPSDVNDPRKMAVSANRLVTALALGLPVAADRLDSYAEFAAYFTDIRSSGLAQLLADPLRYSGVVEDAQKTVVPRFGKAAVAAQWARVLG